MRFLMVIFSSISVMACSSHEKKEALQGVVASDSKKEEGKGIDVDRIECGWNKTGKEAEEKCKPEPSKPTIGQKMDQQLSKDAKTLKKFFGIKGHEETNKEETKSGDKKAPETSQK
jgi:hypothetical protein